VREGLRQPGKAAVTLPFQIVADLGGAVARAPLALTKLYYNDAEAFNPHRFTRNRQAGQRYATLRKLYLDKLAGTLDPAERRRNDVIAISEGRDAFFDRKDRALMDRLQWELFLPLKAATVPFIDGLGSADWRNMLRRTREMFERESNFVREWTDEDFQSPHQAKRLNETQVNEQLRWSGREGAVKLFFAKAQTDLAKPDHEYPPINIIGHSMGAIVLGEILHRYPKLPFANVVCMAAACTINDFKYKYAPYLHGQGSTSRFYNLCLNGESDRAEREPWDGFELAPRGSLLVWIDSLLDDPISEDDRTLGRWENALLGCDYIDNDIAGRVTLKAFGRNRLSADTALPVPYDYPPKAHAKFVAEPLKHGQFTHFEYPPGANPPDFAFWRESYWQAEPRQPGEVTTRAKLLQKRARPTAKTRPQPGPDPETVSERLQTHNRTTVLKK
jgi:hypothetical protein